MSEVTTIGLDLAKNVFQVHGADGSGHAVIRKKLRRDQTLPEDWPAVAWVEQHRHGQPVGDETD